MTMDFDERVLQSTVHYSTAATTTTTATATTTTTTTTTEYSTHTGYRYGALAVPVQSVIIVGWLQFFRS